MLRATSALDAAQIPYALIGGNAVASWVSRIDKAAVRNTQDVDLLLRREDLERAKVAMAAAGFIYVYSFSVPMFLDGPDANQRDAVHLIFAGERVKSHDVIPAPQVEESERTADGLLLDLHALVRMKLTSNRDKDRTHVRDMIGVGLIDETWLARLPPELAARLKALLDDPDG